MAPSQPHLKLKVRGRRRYRAWQSREAFLLRHRLHHRPPRSPRCHLPGNHITRDDRNDIRNETRNIAAEVDPRTSPPTSFRSHSSSNQNPYSWSSRPLYLTVPKRRRLSENDLGQNQQRPPTKRRRVSEGDKSKELFGQEFIPITQEMSRVARRHLPREPQMQVTGNDRSHDSIQSPRHRPRPISPLDDSLAENQFDQGFLRDDPTVKDLATREDVESEDEVVDSLVLSDDREPPNNDRITSLRPNTGTSISSVLFNCFLVVLNIGIFTYLYRQIFPYKPFRAVDWYEKATDIAVMEITLSRVVLFGEAALEPTRWKGRPGLLPDPEATLDSGSTGISDYGPISIYKPWETSSNGTYVSEDHFIIDLERVIQSALNDLQEVANHGPPQFKFTRGTSTQFRWSTSSGSFVSPHKSLPTIPDDAWDAYIESDVPDSTILGMPPYETGTPSPTARPREPRIIMNSDPPLSRFEILLKDIIGDLLVTHSITRGSLVYWFPDLAWSKVTAMWFNFDLLLRDQRTHNASFGSDQERLDCMFPSLVYELGDMRPIPTRGKPQDLSDIPDDVPEDYLDEVFRAHYLRISSHNSNPTSNPKRATSSSTTVCRPSKHPTPRQWGLSQANNDTAKRLTENAFHRDDLDLGQKRLNKLRSLWGIVEYSDVLDQACQATDEINQRITQVLSADYHVDIPWGQQVQAVNRLRYVAPFLSDIAAVRLRDMSRRASRGALLVREIDRRQHKLAEDILGGFVTADFLLHFPPIEGLLIDMELMAEWFKTEVASITNLWKSRSERCDAAERRNEEQENHGIIWTRWGRYDTRSDPWGREAICWDVKKERLVNATVEKRCGIK
ncbi:hypothetical protein FPANT_9759 [Fusarium pseudoanthophilum]|uniref:Uncharacterized protein n=1 Tax=Fusarium pseudoanthophilum TaxID=48495 RepID=A0A8H5KUR4_9HYPO|nr:hypothetical protein FPANT_9759 [Fusarium pseudoanthophilum]